MRLSLLSVLAVLGCGRVDFAELRAADAGGARCTINDVVADPLPVSGTTFRYLSFDNMIETVAGVSVTAGPVFATTPVVSAADGTFQQSLTTGGVPIDARMIAQRDGYFTTRVFSDLPFDRPVMGQRAALFTYGDMPIWDPSAMKAVYDTAGETVDPMLGTLNVAVRDCDGNALAGAAVTITPPPLRQFYQNAMGTATNTAATELPFTHAIALGAQPGTAHVSVAAPGYVFEDIDVPIYKEMNNTIVVVHGAPEL